jgi:hypothetical protein
MAAKRRVYADCRLYPSDKNCSLYVAGTEDEVFEVALHHAITSHGHQDTPQFRKDLRSFLKDEPSTK